MLKSLWGNNKEIEMKELILNQKTKQTFIVKAFISLFLGFVFIRGSIFNGIYPFALAIMASVKLSIAPFSLLGILIPSMIFEPDYNSYYYIAASFIILFIKAVYHLITKDEKLSLNIIIASVATIIKSVCFIIIDEADSGAVVLLVAELFLTAGFTYFFSVANEYLNNNKIISISVLSAKEYASLTLFILSIIVSINSFNIGTVNLSMLITTYLILLIASISSKDSVYFSIAISAGLMITNYKDLAFYSVMPLSALIISAFKPAGKYLTTTLYLLVSFSGVILLRFSEESISLLLDTVIGSVLFVLTPQKVLKKVFSYEIAESRVMEIKEILTKKLKNASFSMNILASVLEKLSSKNNNKNKISDSSIISASAEKICKKCSSCSMCWGVKFNDLTDILNKALNSFKNNEPFIAPKYFIDLCPKNKELINDLKVRFENVKNNNIQVGKISVVKSAITENYKSLSFLLSEMADDISKIYEIDNEETKLLSDILNSENIIFSSSTVLHLAGERTSYEFTTNEELSDEKLLSIIEKMGKKKNESFSIPVKTATLNGNTYNFTENQNYEIITETIYLNKKNDEISGDNVLTFGTNGFDYLILADGMGSGKTAARDSILTTNVIRELVLGGLNLRSVIKTAGTMLLSNTDNESATAVDLVKIDKYTGEMSLIKAGGAPTFIKQGCKVTKLYGETIPIGIIGDIKLYEKEIVLSENDVIVNISDGVMNDGTEWLNAILSIKKNKSIDEIKTAIINYINRNGITFSDDATITISILNKI